MNGKRLSGIAAFAGLWLTPAFAQDGSELYATRCAVCHEAPPADAAHPPPPRSELNTMTPNVIYSALTQGVMRMQATGLSNAQMQSVAEFLSGKQLEQLQLEITSNLFESNPPMRDPA